MYITGIFITALVLFFGLTYLLLFTKSGRSFFKDMDGLVGHIPDIIDGDKTDWEKENGWILAITLSLASLVVIMINALLSMVLGLIFPVTIIAIIMGIVFYIKIK